MPLTPEQIHHIVQARWFVIEFTARVTDTSDLGVSAFFGGGYLVSGEGASQLSALQQRLAIYPRATMSIDLLTHSTANFVKFSREDIEALRLAFLAKYGNTLPPQPAPPVETPP